MSIMFSGEAWKVCTACGTEKPLTAFTPAPRGKGGVRSQCRACISARREARRARAPRKPRVYNTRQYRRNRASILAGNPPCALCGLPGADTADHKMPIARGGTSDLSNLQPAHHQCNSSRQDRITTRFTAKW